MNVLCSLAMDDMVGAKKNIQSHSIDDAAFDGSQEHRLCEDLIKCIEDNGANREEFNAIVGQYNAVHPANKARNSLLVKI